MYKRKRRATPKRPSKQTKENRIGNRSNSRKIRVAATLMCDNPRELRRSQRIQNKNNGSIQIFNSVSDYFMQTDQSGSIFKEITDNYQRTLSNTKESFCLQIKRQVQYTRDDMKMKCLKSIRSLVVEIDSLLESNIATPIPKVTETPLLIPRTQWIYKTPKSIAKNTESDTDFTCPNFTVFPAFKTSEKSGFHLKKNFFSPAETLNCFDSQDSALLDFLTDSPASVQQERSFNLDEALLLPTMPDLKNPSPLKFHPRLI